MTRIMFTCRDLVSKITDDIPGVYIYIVRVCVKILYE